MEEIKKPKRKSPNETYPVRIGLYENEEGAELLKELARRRGLSDTAFLRALIREEAKREGLSLRREPA